MAVSKDTNNLVEGISYRGSNGILGPVIPVGATGDNVYVTTGSEKNKDLKTYSLQHFFENYMDFMNNGRFIAYGSVEPQNKTHFPIWIDTNK